MNEIETLQAELRATREMMFSENAALGQRARARVAELADACNLAIDTIDILCCALEENKLAGAVTGRKTIKEIQEVLNV